MPPPNSNIPLGGADAIRATGAAVTNLTSSFDKLASALPIGALMELERAQNSIGIQASDLADNYSELNQIVTNLSKNTKILSRIQSTELLASYRANLENLRFTNQQLEKNATFLAKAFPSAYRESAQALQAFASRHKDLAANVMDTQYSLSVHLQAIRDNDAAVVAYEKKLQSMRGAAEKTTTTFMGMKAALKDIYTTIGQASSGGALDALMVLFTGVQTLRGFGAFGKGGGAMSMPSIPGKGLSFPGGPSQSMLGRLRRMNMGAAGLGVLGLATAAAGGTVAHYRDLADQAGEEEVETSGNAASADYRARKLKINRARGAKGLGEVAVPEMAQNRVEMYTRTRQELEAQMVIDSEILDIEEAKMQILDKMYAPAQARLPLLQNQLSIFEKQKESLEKQLSTAKALAAENLNDPNRLKEVRTVELQLLELENRRLDKVNFIRRSMLEGMVGGYVNVGAGGPLTPGALNQAQTQMSGYSQGALQTTGGMVNGVSGETVGPNTKSYSQWMMGLGVSPGSGQQMPEMIQQVLEMLKTYLPAIEAAAGTLKVGE